MDLESAPMKNPEPKRRGKLILNKETIKNLRMNGSSKNEAARFPSVDSCSECCDPDPSEFCDV